MFGNRCCSHDSQLSQLTAPWLTRVCISHGSQLSHLTCYGSLGPRLTAHTMHMAHDSQGSCGTQGSHRSWLTQLTQLKAHTANGSYGSRITGFIAHTAPWLIQHAVPTVTRCTAYGAHMAPGSHASQLTRLMARKAGWSQLTRLTVHIANTADRQELCMPSLLIWKSFRPQRSICKLYVVGIMQRATIHEDLVAARREDFFQNFMSCLCVVLFLITCS